MPDGKYPFRLIRSSCRSIALQITPEGELVVRCPSRMPVREVEAFVSSKADWIEKHMATRRETANLPRFTAEEIQALARQAMDVIPARVVLYAPKVGVSYGRITIRNQRTRWGSCSAEGNLNFNCLLMLAPPEVLDYVVVHELCHRKEMNHSRRFWAEVERILPDYQLRRKWLKEKGNGLIARLQ